MNVPRLSVAVPMPSRCQSTPQAHRTISSGGSTRAHQRTSSSTPPIFVLHPPTTPTNAAKIAAAAATAEAKSLDAQGIMPTMSMRSILRVLSSMLVVSCCYWLVWHGQRLADPMRFDTEPSRTHIRILHTDYSSTATQEPIVLSRSHPLRQATSLKQLAPEITPSPTVMADSAKVIPAMAAAAVTRVAVLTSTAPALPPVDLPPFTIFSILRDMDNSTSDAARYSIQMHALRSWQFLVGGPAFNSRLIVFMDSAASCKSLLAIRPPGETTDAFLGLHCVPIPCWHAEFKRPLMNCLFETAHRMAETEHLLYVNGDILLNPALAGRLEHLVKVMAVKQRTRYLAVARRTDVDLLPQHIIGAEAPLPDAAQLNDLIQHAKATGTVHGEYGLDIFFYTKNIFSTPSLRDFPPYIAGVFRWDNWFLAECMLRNDIDTVDLSPLLTPDHPDAMLVHQNDPVVRTHRTRVGSVVNENLAHVRSGDDYKFGSITNCKWILTPDTHHGSCDTGSHVACPLRLEANWHRQLAVQFRLVATQQGHFFVLPVVARTFQAAYFANFMCFVRQHRMRHFVLVVDDEALATSLREELDALFADPAVGLTEHQAFVFAMPHTDVQTLTEAGLLRSLTPLHELLPESALSPRSVSVLAAQDKLLHRLEFEAFYIDFLRHVTTSGFSPIHLDLLSATHSGSSLPSARTALRMRSGVVLTGADVMATIEAQIARHANVSLDLMYVVASPAPLSATTKLAKTKAASPPPAPASTTVTTINPSMLILQRSTMCQYFLGIALKCAVENVNNFLAFQSATKPTKMTRPVECLGSAFKKLRSSRLVKRELDPQLVHVDSELIATKSEGAIVRLDDAPLGERTPGQAEAAQIRRWTTDGHFHTSESCPTTLLTTNEVRTA